VKTHARTQSPRSLSARTPAPKTPSTAAFHPRPTSRLNARPNTSSPRSSEPSELRLKSDADDDDASLSLPPKTPRVDLALATRISATSAEAATKPTSAPVVLARSAMDMHRNVDV
jgi:hypothetical protein